MEEFLKVCVRDDTISDVVNEVDPLDADEFDRTLAVARRLKRVFP